MIGLIMGSRVCFVVFVDGVWSRLFDSREKSCKKIKIPSKEVLQHSSLFCALSSRLFTRIPTVWLSFESQTKSKGGKSFIVWCLRRMKRTCFKKCWYTQKKMRIKCEDLILYMREKFYSFVWLNGAGRDFLNESVFCWAFMTDDLFILLSCNHLKNDFTTFFLASNCELVQWISESKRGWLAIVKVEQDRDTAERERILMQIYAKCLPWLRRFFSKIEKKKESTINKSFVFYEFILRLLTFFFL